MRRKPSIPGSRWQKMVLVLDAAQSRATEILDNSIEANNDNNPFLRGVYSIPSAEESTYEGCPAACSRQPERTREQTSRGRFVISDFQREFEWKPWDISELMPYSERGMH